MDTTFKICIILFMICGVISLILASLNTQSKMIVANITVGLIDILLGSYFIVRYHE